MQRSIVVFVCLFVLLSSQIGICQPAVGEAAGKEKPAASGIDALEVVKVVYIPYKVRERFRFMTYDVPANVKKPSDITVQITPMDRGNKTFFVPVGDDIPGIGFVRADDLREGTALQRAKYTVKSFKKIEANGKNVSEITIKDNETGAEFVLPLKEIVDLLQDCYAIFHYKWTQPGGRPTPDFPKRVGQTFTLPPEEGKKYRVIRITSAGVLIELPDETRKTLDVPK